MESIYKPKDFSNGGLSYPENMIVDYFKTPEFEDIDFIKEKEEIDEGEKFYFSAAVDWGSLLAVDDSEEDYFDLMALGGKASDQKAWALPSPQEEEELGEFVTNYFSRSNTDSFFILDSQQSANDIMRKVGLFVEHKKLEGFEVAILWGESTICFSEKEESPYQEPISFYVKIFKFAETSVKYKDHHAVTYRQTGGDRGNFIKIIDDIHIELN